MVQEIELIQNETIVDCKFLNDIQLNQQKNLLQQIKDATILGNSHRTIVTIIFQDDTGIKRVDTTIWASGAKFICLKGGLWIPINRIIEILI
jgi:hypothetical protein